MIEEYKEKYLGLVEKILDSVNKGDLKKYLDIGREPINKIGLLDPLEKIIVLLLIFILIFETIPAIIATIISSIFIMIITGALVTPTLLIPLLVDLTITGTVILLAGLLNILLYIIYAGLEYIVAKILNGAGELKEHISISIGSLLTVYILSIPLMIITAIIAMLGSIPFFEIIICLLFLPIFVLGLLQLFISLYGLYIKLVMVKELHNFDTGKALITMFTPLVVLGILALIIGIIIIVFFSASLVSIMALQQQFLPNLMI